MNKDDKEALISIGISLSIILGVLLIIGLFVEIRDNYPSILVFIKWLVQWGMVIGFSLFIILGLAFYIYITRKEKRKAKEAREYSERTYKELRESLRKPWNLCHNPEERCTMSYCDEMGCLIRKNINLKPTDGKESK